MISSVLGENARARREIALALERNPNDRVARLVRKRLEEGTPIDPNLFNRVYRNPGLRIPGLEYFKHGTERA